MSEQKKIDDGGPTYPQGRQMDETQLLYHSGETRRQKLARSAMQAFLIRADTADIAQLDKLHEILPFASYKIADFMLAYERAEGGKKL